MHKQKKAVGKTDEISEQVGLHNKGTGILYSTKGNVRFVDCKENGVTRATVNRSYDKVQQIMKVGRLPPKIRGYLLRRPSIPNIYRNGLFALRQKE